MKQPFFTEADAITIDFAPLNTKAVVVGIETANAKVQPVLERIAELEAANKTNGIVYVKPDLFCVDTMEHEHLRKRLTAAEEALDTLSNTVDSSLLLDELLAQDWDVLNDAVKKARAHFEKYGDKP